LGASWLRSARLVGAGVGVQSAVPSEPPSLVHIFARARRAGIGGNGRRFARDGRADGRARSETNGRARVGARAKFRPMAASHETRQNAQASPTIGAGSGWLNVVLWTDAHKVLACSLLTLPFAFGWLVRSYQLQSDLARAPYVDRAFLSSFLPFLWLHALGHTAIVAIAFALHLRKTEKAAWLVQLEIQFWAISLSVSLYALGSFTTPFSVLLVALPVFGFLLFGSAMKAGLFTMSFGVAAGMVLPQVGILPYAPFFRTAPFADGHLNPTWIASFGVPSIFAAIVVVAMQVSLLGQLRARQVELERLSGTDVLTGLANRAMLFERLAAEMARARRHKQPVSVAMLDVDHFKRINDTFGHLEGDRVLRKVAERLKSMLRIEDFAGRYGGEEFTLILPNTGVHQAASLAERLRVGAHAIEVGTSPDALPFSVSIGLAQYDGQETVDQLVARADDALYRAKRSGRDQVALDGQLGT
jgi:diguanylate cyclase (GGDEF)-like protein